MEGSLKNWQIATSIAIAASLAFGGGLLVGRQFPAHHFERFGETAFLYDTSSGRMCNPFKDDNPYAEFGGQPVVANAKAGDYLPKCER
jgi:hypothetical protein